ncbi:hypothetical protein [Thiomicrorhabdus xiamenensis]|uniref:DUF3990 domain-containing protein n=1 Tax=Thiomicrorhabdus xiamenensis TaxID=2739063 RepID=A0A7D4SZH2_9GAMM|nr:hypothetical protein [Thiomicrorhabdus xiamenensis]QKI89924.1 hypothetical protein HQN79_10225 [Thiomicrorhabdus xiamenensis]
MYNSKPAVIYGFHGIDREAALNILNHKDQFLHSNNSYDWLGQGIYFWENNLERAKQYAKKDSERKESSIKDPFVLGSVIELGNCMDLLDQRYIDFLPVAYEDLKDILAQEGKTMPVNAKFYPSDTDESKRELDCAVIRHACTLWEEIGNPPFDSVRAVFIEGDEVYNGAKFYTGSHIQIAIINHDCIKGIFLPREAGQKPVFAEPK